MSGTDAQDGSDGASQEVGLTAASREQMESFRVAHATQVLTILLSDIEGSTHQQTTLGNVKAASLVMAHREVFRRVLAGMDGQEVETAGDSFLVVFAAPSEAVLFALRLQAALREARQGEQDLPGVRVGIHQGQVVVERHAEGPKALDIYGLQVSTAARITDLGTGGQILCTRAVFDDARAILNADDLADLAGVSWCNHGPYRFRGVADSHEVCEVGQAPLAPLQAPPATAKSWPADAGTEQLGWRPAVGTVVPETNWVLEERLGRLEEPRTGGMQYRGEFGEVWRAWNPADKSRQVFKFCFRHDRLPALKREARLLKRLRKHRHPNLVTVYDVTERDQPPHYLEMEYVPGPSLEEWLADDPPRAERLEMIAQVADALGTVHAAGICHRDIKPSNILLTHREDGALQAKLTDFGLGAAEDEELLRSIEVSRVSGVAGTWDYIAPEVRAGGKATPASDLYSLGLTLYQVVVGDLRGPLAADWEARVGCEVLAGDIRRCVAADPPQRWPNAAELAQALRGLDERVRAARLEREREQQRARASRLRRLTAISAAFALVTIGFGAFATWQWHQARVQGERADQQRQLAQANADKAERQKRQTQLQRDATRHQLGLAFLERCRMLQRERMLVSTYLVGGRAVGFPHGGTALQQRYEPLLRAGSEGDLQARGMLLTSPFPLLWQSPRVRHHDSFITALGVSGDGKTVVSAGWCGETRLWDFASGRHLGLLGRSNRAAVGLCILGEGGRQVAVADDEGTALIWDLASHKVVGRLADGLSGVRSLAASADGATVATGHADGSVVIWSSATRRPIARWPAGARPVTALAFDPRGKLLARGHESGVIELWDLRAGKPAGTLTGHGALVLALSFRPDGLQLASGGWDGTLHVWDLSTRASVKQLRPHGGPVHCVQYSGGGSYLASGGADGTIHLWDPQTVELLRVLTGHTLRVTALAFVGKPAALISAAIDGTVRVWDPATGKAKGTLAGHTGNVWSVDVSPDGRTVASGSADGTVRLWDLATGSLRRTLTGHGNWVQCVRFSPDGRQLASASADGTICLWDPKEGHLQRRLLGHKMQVTSLAFRPDGKALVSGSWSARVILWDLTTGKPLAEHAAHSGAVYDVCFNRDGKTIASVGEGTTMYLWSGRKGEAPVARRLTQHSGPQHCVRFAPNGKMLATGGEDGKVCFWGAEKGEFVGEFPMEAGWVLSLAFRPDGKALAVGCERRLVQVWDLVRHQRVACLEGPGGWFRGVAYTPDGSKVVCGGVDGSVRLWDTEPLDRPDSLRGHISGVFRLAFSPAGGLIGTAGMDHAVRLWDPRSGQLRATLAARDSIVRDISFRADGKQVAARDAWAGGFRVWSISGGRDSPLACKRLETPGETSKTTMCLAYHPRKPLLATGHSDGAVRLWDTRQWTQAKAFTNHTEEVQRIRFSPDGRLLATIHDTGMLRVRDAVTGRILAKVPGDPQGFGAMAFSPDGHYLAVALQKHTCMLLDVTPGGASSAPARPAAHTAAVLRGKFGWVHDMSFRADGAWLALGSSHGHVSLWDVARRSQIATLGPQSSKVLCVRFSPTGSTLAWNGGGGVVRLWRPARQVCLPDSLAEEFRFEGLQVSFPDVHDSLYRGRPGFRVGP